MSKLELTPYTNFSITELDEFFSRRGWKVELVKAGNYDLVVADEGSALECIDGRFANLPTRKKNGPKIPGALNAIAALKTGGDQIGFNLAAREVQRSGFNPGTHGAEHPGPGCGYHFLWLQGLLGSSVYRFGLPQVYIQKQGISSTDYIKKRVHAWGGKHFRLPGEHEEEALVLNPLRGTTVLPNAQKFSYDKWYLRDRGISPLRSALVVAETIENLVPQSKRVEIIIP